MELGEKQLSKKKLIIASGQLIFWLVETIFFSIFQTPAGDSFFLVYWKRCFKEILHSGWWKWILELIMVSARRKKAVSKRILFLQNENFDSTSRNDGFVKKIRFHCAKKLLSPEGIYI